MAPELKLPPFPAAGEHLWDAFLDLNRGRTSGMNGAERLSWVDIQAWCNLRQKQLSSEEIDVILDIDREWMNAR